MRQTLYDRRTGKAVRSFEPSPSWLKDQQVVPHKHIPKQVNISQSVLLWVGLYLISLALIGLWWLKKWTGL